uniref:Uncharacterized protein n=1 Tax=Anguilla anguilla TaxID=7936 RepID=A0A0E9PS45_ANGAN
MATWNVWSRERLNLNVFGLDVCKPSASIVVADLFALNSAF